MARLLTAELKTWTFELSILTFMLQVPTFKLCALLVNYTLMNILGLIYSVLFIALLIFSFNAWVIANKSSMSKLSSKKNTTIKENDENRQILLKRYLRTLGFSILTFILLVIIGFQLGRIFPVLY